MARRRRYNHKRRRGSLSFLYKLLAFVLICTAISLALTLFFRIRSIEVSGNDRYTRQEIIDAAGVSEGDNMFLMNKYSAAERIRKALPYIETVQFRRSLPDGLSIIVTECADPAAIVQDGKAYLLCDTGNIVDEVTPAAAKQRYLGRFDVQLPREADYGYKLDYLMAVVEKLEVNEKGAINMMQEGKARFIPE